MAICPDIFQFSPQTICLKIPNVVVERHGADGETSAAFLTFQANQLIGEPTPCSLSEEPDRTDRLQSEGHIHFTFREAGDPDLLYSVSKRGKKSPSEYNGC